MSGSINFVPMASGGSFTTDSSAMDIFAIDSDLSVDRANTCKVLEPLRKPLRIVSDLIL